MKTKTRKYLYILIASQIVICIVTSILMSLLIKNMANYVVDALEQEALNITQRTMQERVENMIGYIDHERETVLSVIKTQGEFISRMAARTATEDRKFLYDWVEFLDTMTNGKALQLVLYDAYTQEKTEFIKTSNGIEEVKTIVPITEWYSYAASCPYHIITPYNNKSLYVLASEERINQVTKEFIYRLIHDTSYGTGGYVWVHEIRNYEGGDEYAIRLMHPKFPETEGMYLSTNTMDAEGKFPYKVELEGILKDGEIFHTYHFQDQQTEPVSKKASYAKLYEPFNWVVATGEPLSNVFFYAQSQSMDLATYSKGLTKTISISIISLMILVFTVDIVVILLNYMRRSTQLQEYIEKETTIDPLTGALNRKSGTEFFSTIFQQFQKDGHSPLIMMLDLDNFKKTNDTYGHDVGDEVLRRATQEILNNIRSTDKLFRWGGEEFILVFAGVEKDFDRTLSDKILSCVNQIQFETDRGSFHTSISIGAAWFRSTDTNWQQALKRADMALYHSKGTGKNCYTNYDNDIELNPALEHIFIKQQEENPDVSSLYEHHE
jgi:diguanylate cyclase (GGDEF)-like protein